MKRSIITTKRTQTMTSCFISYVGKANFGAAERYIREMYTEVYSTHALGAESVPLAARSASIVR